MYASHVIRRRTPLLAAVAALAACAVASPADAAQRARSAQSCANADLVPSTTNTPAVRRATLCLINAERRSRGLRILRGSARLRSAAQRYAMEMVAQDFFAHVSPTGSTFLQRIRRTAYLSNATAWSVGENLAWGTGALTTPAQTVRGWMESPRHRRNVLDRAFREIGIGVAIGAPGTDAPGATYATEYGRRA